MAAVRSGSGVDRFLDRRASNPPCDAPVAPTGWLCGRLDVRDPAVVPSQLEGLHLDVRGGRRRRRWPRRWRRGPGAEDAAASSVTSADRSPRAARTARPADTYAMSFSILSGRTFTEVLAGLAFTGPRADRRGY